MVSNTMCQPSKDEIAIVERFSQLAKNLGSFAENFTAVTKTSGKTTWRCSLAPRGEVPPCSREKVKALRSLLVKVLPSGMVLRETNMVHHHSTGKASWEVHLSQQRKTYIAKTIIHLEQKIASVPPTLQNLTQTTKLAASVAKLKTQASIKEKARHFYQMRQQKKGNKPQKLANNQPATNITRTPKPVSYNRVAPDYPSWEYKSKIYRFKTLDLDTLAAMRTIATCNCSSAQNISQHNVAQQQYGWAVSTLKRIDESITATDVKSLYDEALRRAGYTDAFVSQFKIKETITDRYAIASHFGPEHHILCENSRTQ